MKINQDGVFGKLLQIIQQLNIYLLVMIPLVASLLTLAILLSIGNQIYQGNLPEIYLATSGVIFLLILSLSGLVQILRREGPGFFGQPVFGLLPVITGSIIIAICWIVSIILLIRIYGLIAS